MYINMSREIGDFDETRTEDKGTEGSVGDDDVGEEETTNPFQPGAASTPSQPPGPYHVDETHEMNNFGLEQSGFDDTDPLLPQTSQTATHQTQSTNIQQKLRGLLNL